MFKNHILLKISIILFMTLINNCQMYSQAPNWENLGLKDTVISDIAFDDSGNIYIVTELASQPPVYKSTDNGKSWESKSNGIDKWDGTSIDIDSKGNIYLTAFGGVFKSTNGGENWFRIANNLTNLEFYRVKVIPNDYIFVSNFDGIFRSTDYGITWDSTDYTYFGAQEIGINANGIMFAGNITASWASIFRSTNFGKNWVMSSQLPTNALLFPSNGDVFASVSDPPFSDIYKSTDDGLTWNRTYVFSSSNQIFKDLESDRNNNFYVIVSGDSNGVYFSSDTGRSWRYYGLSDYAGSLNCLTTDSKGNVFVGSLKDGIFRTAEGTTPVELISFDSEIENNSVKLTWITANEINNYGFEIERKENNKDWEFLYFVKGTGTSTERHIYNYKDEYQESGEYFYRLKQIDYDGSFEYSKIIEVNSNLNISSFNLFQNYPNPFNPTTKIKYSIPSVNVGNENFRSLQLKVYDILGREVAILVNEKKQPGNYEVEFDASKYNLCSGIYFYSIKSGKF